MSAGLLEATRRPNDLGECLFSAPGGVRHLIPHKDSARWVLAFSATQPLRHQLTRQRPPPAPNNRACWVRACGHPTKRHGQVSSWWDSLILPFQTCSHSKLEPRRSKPHVLELGTPSQALWGRLLRRRQARGSLQAAGQRAFSEPTWTPAKPLTPGQPAPLGASLSIRLQRYSLWVAFPAPKPWAL